MAGRRRTRERRPAYATDRALARIARKLAARAQVRREDARLDPVDHCLLSIIDERTYLGYGDGRLGVPRLAALVHRAERTVRRHMRTLECLGYVEVVERHHGHGGPAVNVYRVLTPRPHAGGWLERQRRRDERDAARKRPRRRGGTDTSGTRPYTRGCVNARSGTGEHGGRPALPAGGGQSTGRVRAMAERALSRAEADTRREVEARWERMAAAGERVEAVGGGAERRERDAGERDAGRGQVAELIARAQAAQARRLGVGPGAPWERDR